MKISRRGTLISYVTPISYGDYTGWEDHYFTIFKTNYGIVKEYTLTQLYTEYIIVIHA